MPFGIGILRFDTQGEAEQYRKRAEECRQMASKVISPLDKEAWLKLAEDWLRLALNSEKREGPTKPKPPQSDPS